MSCHPNRAVVTSAGVRVQGEVAEYSGRLAVLDKAERTARHKGETVQVIFDSWDVETAFTASVTMTLGDSDDADGYAAAADVAATVISTGCAFEDTSAGNTFNRGRRYGSTQSIDVTVAGADALVGVINVYCVYSYAPEYATADTGGSANT